MSPPVLPSPLPQPPEEDAAASDVPPPSEPWQPMLEDQTHLAATLSNPDAPAPPTLRGEIAPPAHRSQDLAAPPPDAAPAPLSPQEQAARVRKRVAEDEQLRRLFPAQMDAGRPPGQLRLQEGNIALMARDYGKPPKEIAQAYHYYLQDYASQVFHLTEGVTDESFYRAGQKKISQERDGESAQLDGMRAYIVGQEAIPAKQAWEKAHADRLPHSADFDQGYQAARQKLGKYQQLTDSFLDAVEKKTGQRQTKPADLKQYLNEVEVPLEKARASLVQMDDEERANVYAILAMKAEARGYDVKGFFGQMGSFLEQQDELVTESLKTGVWDLLDWATDKLLLNYGFNEDFQSGEIDPNSVTGIMDKEREARSAERAREFAIFKEVQDFISGHVDPMKPTLGWMNETLEQGLKAAPGAVLPYLAISASTGFVGGTALMSLDFYTQGKHDLMVNHGLSHSQAHEVALTGAPLKAGVESFSNLFQLGRFSRLRNALPGLTRPITRWGADRVLRQGQNSLVFLGTEVLEEQVQGNLIDPAVQSMLRVGDPSMPAADWARYGSQALQQFPELLSTLALPALLFGGRATSAQVRLSERMTKDITALQALNFSQAQAVEISALKTQEERISRAQDLWTRRAGTPATLEEAQQKLGAQTRRLLTDAQAARQELERRGLLPRAYRTPQDTWRLTFNDGSTADFHSAAQADAAAGHYIHDQLGKEHAATREFLSSLLKNLEMGREVAVQIKSEARTVTQAEVAASPALQQRIVQKDTLQGIITQLQEEGAQADTATTQESIALAQVTGDQQGAHVVAQILGSSLNENYDSAGHKISTRTQQDDVLRTTIKLYNGANALTLVEEKLEGDAKVILERQGGRDWLLSRLRAYEKDSGDTLLRAVADDTELQPSDLIEAWSHLGQSYLLGRSTFGAPLQNGRMAEMLQSLASAGLSSAVNAESQFWNMVQARAQKLGELHAAGKLDATMAAELESQLGIGAGTDVEALTQVGGKARAGSTENSPDSAGKKANASELDTETYSVRSVDSPLSLEDAQARLRSLSGTPLTTADGLTATVSNATAAKMTSASATRKSASMQAHLAAIGAFQELFSRGRITETKPDRNNDVNIKAIHRVKAMMLLEGQPHEVKFTVKEFARADQGGRIYSIESVETEDASERKRVDSTVLPEGGPTSTPQSEARVQEWASNDESQATHSLVTPPANTDPRLVKAFPDWPHGWDEHGFPNPPRTLSDEDPLLKITRKKKTAILSPDHPLVQSGQLPADKDVPREAMRKAIADHFINQSQPLPQGVQPVIYAMGGGGGSGKSSLIAILQDQGVIPADGYVLINTDEIKKFIPEYDDIIRAGDGRAANVVQLESVDIANQIMDRLNSGGEKIRHHIIFDSTLANANETRRLISLWKAAGFKVHLVGIIIDPKEALTRAFGRILDEKRWVPAAALAKAHQGFNAALKSYLSEVDEAEIYDNSGDTPVVVARKTSTSPDVMVVEPKIWNSIDQRSHETLSR